MLTYKKTEHFVIIANDYKMRPSSKIRDTIFEIASL